MEGKPGADRLLFLLHTLSLGDADLTDVFILFFGWYFFCSQEGCFLYLLLSQFLSSKGSLHQDADAKLLPNASLCVRIRALFHLLIGILCWAFEAESHTYSPSQS